MSLNKFETFIRKLARVLYDDELTPILIDYLIKHQFGEPSCMAYALKLKDGTTKAEKGIRRNLDNLVSHGILIKKDVKKKAFQEQQMAERAGIKFEDIQYPENPATLSVYSFHCDLMLILKARLYKLRDITLRELDKLKNAHQIMYTCSARCKPSSHERPIAQIDAQRTKFKCDHCQANLKHTKDNDLSTEEEQRCKEVVNKLYQEMLEFDTYRIPPAFFGPLQLVDYDGIGGSFVENVDDVEFNVKAEAATRQEVKAREYRRRLEELSREVPQIVKYYQEQNMIALKSKGIKKAKKKQ